MKTSACQSLNYGVCSPQCRTPFDLGVVFASPFRQRKLALDVMRIPFGRRPASVWPMRGQGNSSMQRTRPRRRRAPVPRWLPRVCRQRRKLPLRLRMSSPPGLRYPAARISMDIRKLLLWKVFHVTRSRAALPGSGSPLSGGCQVCDALLPGDPPGESRRRVSVFHGRIASSECAVSTCGMPWNIEARVRVGGRCRGVGHRQIRRQSGQRGFGVAQPRVGLMSNGPLAAVGGGR